MYAPYCDGASRAGDLALPVTYKGKSLFYRGFRVLRATIAALLAPSTGAMPSLADASSLLVSGSSAGGLTTFLHAVSALKAACTRGCCALVWRA